MEVLCVRLSTTDGPVIILNVYRPGSERPTALFYDELTSIFETLVAYSCPVVIGGDFNVKVQKADDFDSRRLADLLTSFDMVQHVRGETHRCKNTLDLVRRPLS
jgi:exonuclease III